MCITLNGENIRCLARRFCLVALLTLMCVHDYLLLQMSTLDLVAPDRLGLNMLLVCSGSTDACSSWIAAGQQLQQQGWPVQVLQILGQGAPAAQLRQEGEAASSNSSSSVVGEPQQCAVAVDVEGMWGSLHRGVDSVALLVRPDGHVAWRQVQQQGAQLATHVSVVGELLRLLQQVLHLQAPSSDS